MQKMILKGGEYLSVLDEQFNANSLTFEIALNLDGAIAKHILQYRRQFRFTADGLYLSPVSNVFQIERRDWLQHKRRRECCGHRFDFLRRTN